jgi:plastocyanin
MLTRRESGTLIGAAFLCLTTVRSGMAQHTAHEHHINIDGFAFEPQMLEVAVGDTVTWHNHDLAPHTATSENGTWDSDALTNDASFTLTFSEPGQFRYFCAFHPNMTGEVIATEA